VTYDYANTPAGTVILIDEYFLGDRRCSLLELSANVLFAYVGTCDGNRGRDIKIGDVLVATDVSRDLHVTVLPNVAGDLDISLDEWIVKTPAAAADTTFNSKVLLRAIHARKRKGPADEEWAKRYWPNGLNGPLLRSGKGTDIETYRQILTDLMNKVLICC